MSFKVLPRSCTAFLRVSLLICTGIILTQWNLHLQVFSRNEAMVDINLPVHQFRDHPTSNSALDIDYHPETSNIPNWLKSYAVWHSRQRAIFDQEPTEWLSQNKTRLLLLRCLAQDRCGGTADRLKSLPLFLAVAAKTERILLLFWERPFALESFLPPGPWLNWSIPELVLDQVRVKESTLHTEAPKLLRAASDRNQWLVQGNVQQTGNRLFAKIATSLQDDSILEPLAFWKDLFRMLFQPTPSLRQLASYYMQELQLVPGSFVATHYRAKYPGEPYRETGNETAMIEIVENGIRCSMGLHSSTSVYMASDTLLALRAAQTYGRKQNIRVVTHLDARKEVLPHEDPLHLNFGGHKNKTTEEGAFSAIFVDMLLLSQSACVSFGAGGFGRFGSLISWNASCRMAHSNRGKMNLCK